MDNQIINIQSILIICRFCICKFGYSLKFICNLQIITHGASMVTCQHAQSSEKSESPKGMFPTVVEQGDTLPSCFQLPYCKQVSFLQSVQYHVLQIFVLSIGIWLFKMAPEYSAGVLQLALEGCDMPYGEHMYVR